MVLVRGRNMVLELLPWQNEGQGHPNPPLRAAARLGSVYFQIGPFRAMQGRSVQWVPGIAHMKFSKKKIAKGQTLDPNSNLYLEVQLFKKKKKKPNA